MNDTQILNWLLENITYMEHGVARGAFWPHLDPQGDKMIIFEEDKEGLTLREYVEARIKEQS